MATYTLTGSAVGTSCGSTGVACVCRSIPCNQPAPKVVSSLEIKSPRPLKGDMVTATPYSTSIYELEPVVGTYAITQRSRQSSSSSHVRDCGADRAGNTYVYTGNVGLYGGVSIPVMPEWDDDVTAALGISQTKALAALTSSLMNVPLLIAERKQTFDTIRRHGDVLSGTIADTYKKAMTRWKRPMTAAARRRLATDIANEHLAILFGLLPLIDEVKGAIELFVGLAPPVVTARGRQAFVSTDEYASNDFPSLPFNSKHWARPFFKWEGEVFTRVSARTSITVSIGDPALLQKLRDVGFNPLAASFDLIPLSFLVGWFSNLDTWVRSLDPAPDLHWVRGSTTVWRERIDSVKYEMYDTNRIAPDGSGWSQSGEALGSGFGRVLGVDRMKLDTFPDRSLHLYNNLSWAKAVTGVALAVQRYYKPLMNIRVPKEFRYRGPRPKYLPPIKYTKY